ncbi:MAG TPA: T9SS type A sorting domain-containing protein [Bacteroidia bacterium]|nr:T9SS type A sorting domain-containing protein [Bacteroidia bacterium]
MRKILLLAGLLITSLAAQAQSYNYYFGNIHAHTGYSDGNKDSATSLMSTPLQDFNYAKQSNHIDFYGISEHNHLQAGLKSPGDYHQGILDADVVNVDGQFVAMYGMEWGVISNGGHVIIYGIDSLIGWDTSDYDIFNAEYDYTSLWKKVNARPGAFAYLAHPQTTDYDSIFLKPLSTEADSAIVGMCARSGPAFSTVDTYTDASTGNYIPRYKQALQLGYHVGIGLDHDTHYSVFGRQTAGRLVVLASSLTRLNVLDAIRSMRMYSSDDWNTKVDFNIGSQPMGSIITQAYSPVISVNVNDPDGEATSSIKVYGGIPGSGVAPTLITSNVNSNTLTYTATIANNSTYYYYLQITQADTDVIWTSPIWYTRNDALANGISTFKTENIFNLYPNPSNGFVNIVLQEVTPSGFEIEVTNELGQLVYTESTSNMLSTTLDLHDKKGFYIVKVKSAAGISTKKIMIE